MLRKIICDKYFWAAFMAAPLFVVVLYFVSPPINWVWAVPFIAPLLLLILVFPLLEEIAFRGLLQGWLLQYSKGSQSWAGVSLANILTSSVFVATHFLYHSPVWAMVVFIPSIIFGYFRERYSSIKPAIILHCWYNACYYIVYMPA